MEGVKADQPQKMIRLPFVAALATLVLTSVACAQTADPGETSEGAIKISALPPLTGAGGPYGEGMLTAMQMAVDSVNQAGGPMGRKIDLVVEDGQTDPDAAVRAAQKLIDVNRVSTILGTWDSSTTLAVAPLAIQNEVLLMSTSGASEISTLDDEDLVWRLEAPAPLFGEALARAALQRDLNTAVVMALNDPSALGDAKGFVDYYSKNGGEVLDRIVFNEQDSLGSEVQQALSKNADVVLLAAYTPEITTIFREAFETGEDQIFLGQTFGISEEVADAVGADAAEGALAVNTIPDVDSPVYDAVKEEFDTASSISLTSNVYAAQAYDMIVIVALAMAKCECTDAVGIAEVIREVTNEGGEGIYRFKDGAEVLADGGSIDYRGLTGDITFDEHGDPVTPVFGLFTMRDGSLVLQQSIRLDDAA